MPCDENEGITHYLLASTSNDMMAALQRGMLSVCEALAQPWIAS